jgi:hypothetical protein
MTDARHIVKFRAPDGAESFLCHQAPGKTPDRAQALAFVSAHVAHRAGSAAIHGSPDAFWNSERESARRTAEAHKRWTYTVEPV